MNPHISFKNFVFFSEKRDKLKEIVLDRLHNAVKTEKSEFACFL